jgi:hypothetical protein
MYNEAIKNLEKLIPPEHLEEFKIRFTQEKREERYEPVGEYFRVYIVNINADNVKKFTMKDNRVKTKRFEEERKGLENALIKFDKEGGKRYDLTVFTFNHNISPYFLTDGSHRIEALKRLFKKGKINKFEMILIPDTLIPFNNNACWKQLEKQNEVLNMMLEKAHIPRWIKKYDLKPLDNGEWIGWSNQKIVDSMGKNMSVISIPHYKSTRQSQIKNE